ncbi:MAG: TlpA disulfide reductase family protein [Gemmatimonadota bacterium]
MSKQWTYVAVIVAGLGIGAWALVQLAPKNVGAEVGNQAPAFDAVDMATGKLTSLKDRYKGQVTLVNIWATWCLPCRAEMPAMEKLYKEFGPAGFKIAAVSVDEGSADPVKQFTREFGITFDVLHDPSRKIEEIYQTTGYPESFLLDRDGIIVKKVIGEHPWSSENSRRLIAQLLGVGSGTPPPTTPDTATASPAEVKPVSR